MASRKARAKEAYKAAVDAAWLRYPNSPERRRGFIAGAMWHRETGHGATDPRRWPCADCGQPIKVDQDVVFGPPRYVHTNWVVATTHEAKPASTAPEGEA